MVIEREVGEAGAMFVSALGVMVVREGDQVGWRGVGGEKGGSLSRW